MTTSKPRRKAGSPRKPTAPAPASGKRVKKPVGLLLGSGMGEEQAMTDAERPQVLIDALVTIAKLGRARGSKSYMDGIIRQMSGKAIEALKAAGLFG